MKKTNIFKGECFALIFLAAITSCTKKNQAPQIAKKSSVDSTVTRLPLPASVSASYSKSLDSAVSDDFNGASVDFTKWQYRTDGTAVWGTSSTYVYTATTGSDHFLTLKGSYADGKGSGITSRAKTKYGFYVVRWQLIGQQNGVADGFHPAIWGSACDFSGPNMGNCIPDVAEHGYHLETDFMETYSSTGTPSWSSHFILLDSGKVYETIPMAPTYTTFPNTSSDWITMGYEYTPTYMAIWQNTNSTWTLLKQMPITANGSSTTNINEAYRTPLYWILSNYYYTPAQVTRDSWLNIDYFYLYDYTGPQ
jgi:hypothetical protein